MGGLGEKLGKVVDRVVIGGAEVWQIEWDGGGVYLLSTDEISGVLPHRPPNRPPSPRVATG
jgi:hypothetical protein